VVVVEVVVSMADKVDEVISVVAVVEVTSVAEVTSADVTTEVEEVVVAAMEDEEVAEEDAGRTWDRTRP
jgi:hypothetical protein